MIIDLCCPEDVAEEFLSEESVIELDFTRVMFLFRTNFTPSDVHLLPREKIEFFTALLYTECGKYQSALYHYRKCYDRAKATKNTRGRAAILGNMGLLYRRLGNLGKAVNYLKRAYRLEREANELYGTAVHLGNIGVVYIDKGKYEIALDYFWRSYHIRTQLHDPNLMANAFYNFACVYSLLHMNEPALNYLSKALKINREKYRTLARSDENLDNIRHLPEFASLLLN